MKKSYKKISLEIIETGERDVIRMSSGIVGDVNPEDGENVFDGEIWWW